MTYLEKRAARRRKILAFTVTALIHLGILGGFYMSSEMDLQDKLPAWMGGEKTELPEAA